MPTVVTLGSVKLAASSGIAWRLVSGTAPYQTEMSVHTSDWRQLSSQIGEPLVLRFDDARGQRTEFKEVYILHRLPSRGPNLVTFLVSDKRWLWPYKLVVRDYNVPRKTGDRTAKNTVPVENSVTIDQYEYRKSSLKQGRERWKAEDAVRDVLQLLERNQFLVESFPIESNGSNAGRISVQNLILRDQGDAALSKVLQMIPGAEVYVRADGKVAVFDGADLDAVDQFAESGLPPQTWDGEKLAFIDRAEIRPSEVHIYYQREVEALFTFSDDYSGGTSASLGRDAPFIENVIPTVDPTTEITEYDPELGANRTKTVPAGTWVEVSKWLEAVNRERPDTWPWTFDVIAANWVIGDLEGVLGAMSKTGNVDTLANANVMMRLQAFKQHFRQTFRVSRRYMERVRDMQPVRVAVLDPITGARAPACAWSQGCIIPTNKGQSVAAPGLSKPTIMYANVDMVTPTDGGQTVDRPPSPMRVEIVDKDIGIFALEWIESPYGTVSSYIPCNLQDERGSLAVPVRDLGEQDRMPMGVGMKLEGTTTGIRLANRLTTKVMVTIVPAAPNNQRQYLRRIVKAEDVSALYRKEFRITNGRGPVYSVFVPPSELTARYAFASESSASTGIAQLLGLSQEDLESAGIDGDEIPGYKLANGQNEIADHATSLAAEIFAQFADSTMGTAVSAVPKGGLKLFGNLASAGITAAPAPSGKCLAVHEFSGVQRAVSRIALLPDAVRNLILGILPNGATPAK